MTDNPTFTRRDAQFDSQGVTCRAWVYEPAEPNGAALVMAHGLAGTRDAGLEPFAEAFADNGYTVVLFDYRHFGASDGEPRQLLSIGKQLQDWQAAVTFCRALPGVDEARIGLWGTSFSGGHVVTTAARDPRIAAISAQGPMLDGLSAALNIMRYAGLGQLLKISAYGAADQVRAWLGRDPVTVPVTAPPGEFAAMSSPDAQAGYGAITPADWRNEMTARMTLYLPLYRPVARAGQLKCPALILACTGDSVAPASAADRLARKAGPQVTLKRYDIGHFDIYVGAARDRAIADQLAFFDQHLGAR